MLANHGEKHCYYLGAQGVSSEDPDKQIQGSRALSRETLLNFKTTKGEVTAKWQWTRGSTEEHSRKMLAGADTHTHTHTLISITNPVKEARLT